MVFVIAPGFINTKNMNSNFLAKKTRDQKSPYYSLTQRISMMNNPESPSVEVARIILKAITSVSTTKVYSR